VHSPDEPSNRRIAHSRKQLARLDPSRARTRKLASLSRIVERNQLASPVTPDSPVREFLEALPNVLAATELRELAARIADVRREHRGFLLMMGAHPLKVGLGPLICGLIRDGVITAIATNGAAIIHDFELAFAGRTSEDVGTGLEDGSFGMAEETGVFLNRAAQIAMRERCGLGEVVGREIGSSHFKFGESSIFAAAHRAGIPATVHVSIGADIVHMHPSADGAAIGAATMSDFHRLAAVVAGLSRGVVLNLGSAVVMPEVFLKALNLARNLGNRVTAFTAADMDFIRNYRPRMNVVERPTRGGGRGIMLTGHHEIMFPLLVAAVLAELETSTRRDARKPSRRRK
jgi:deoxyhypusine synthase